MVTEYLQLLGDTKIQVDHVEHIILYLYLFYITLFFFKSKSCVVTYTVCYSGPVKFSPKSKNRQRLELGLGI